MHRARQRCFELLALIGSPQLLLTKLFPSWTRLLAELDKPGLVYTVRTKFQNFLRSYVEVVYTMQNDAYERNGLTAYSVGDHDIMLNWMTEIIDLLQFFVVSVKFGSDYASREVVLSF